MKNMNLLALLFLIGVKSVISNEYSIFRNYDGPKISDTEDTMNTARQMIAKHKEELDFWQRITKESFSMSMSMSMSMPIKKSKYPTKKPTKRPTQKPTKKNDGSPTDRPTKRPTKENVKNKISLGDPTFFGSGCPEGSVETVLSSDNEALSVLFSKYEAATSGATISDSSSCQLAIPVDVQGNLKVGIFAVDYRGYTFVPEEPGAKSTFNTGKYPS